MRTRTFIIALLAPFALSAPAAAQHQHRSAGHPHSGWHGNIRHFDYGTWHGGQWWHGAHGGRIGWWWTVGPNWYWYPAPVYPYPNPYLPPGAVAGWWYWCDAYRQYYPYVGACPSGWRAMPAR